MTSSFSKSWSCPSSSCGTNVRRLIEEEKITLSKGSIVQWSSELCTWHQDIRMYISITAHYFPRTLPWASIMQNSKITEPFDMDGGIVILLTKKISKRMWMAVCIDWVTFKANYLSTCKGQRSKIYDKYSAPSPDLLQPNSTIPKGPLNKYVTLKKNFFDPLPLCNAS